MLLYIQLHTETALKFTGAILFTSLVLLIPILLTAQELHVSPEMPKPGEVIELRFTPGSDHQEPAFSDPRLYVLLWPAEPGDPEFNSYDMHQEGESWTFKLNELPDNTALLQMKIVDESTGAEATPEQEFWTQGFYKEGEMMPASWYRLSSSYSQQADRRFAQSGAEMFREADSDKAYEIRQQAYERHPDDPHVARMYLQSAARTVSETEEKEQLRDLALRLVDNHPDNPIILSSAGHALRTLEYEEELKSIRERIIKEFPKHSSAEYYRSVAINRAENEEKREMAEAFLADFPTSDRRSSIMFSHVAQPLIEQENWSELYEVFTPASGKDYFALSRSIQQMMRSMQETYAEENEVSEHSSQLALRLFELAEETYMKTLEPGFYERAPYLTDRDWAAFTEQRREAREDGLPNMMRLQKAGALAFSGKHERADAMVSELFSPENATSSYINERYMRVLNITGNSSLMLEIGENAVRKNGYNDTVLDHYRTAWLKTHEAEQSAFNAHLNELIEASKDILREELAANMLDEQAADFTLPTLEGSEISLSDLEGKVVIIDFWATWCGPCVEAFPVFQEVVDAYADNEDVVFLAVNTFEGEYSDERVQKAADFMEKHELDFPVLFDMDEDKAAGAYGVRGIPTQVAIGRDGKLRFEKVGFTGAGMATSMELKIEMLLAREYSAINSD